MTVTPAQVRAARALLDWSQGQLADEALVGRQTIVRFEKGDHTPSDVVMAAIRGALERAGVVFISASEGIAGGAVGLRSEDTPAATRRGSRSEAVP